MNRVLPPRNPKIAAVLHETRFAETKGSGIRVMRETAEKAGLTPPLFESDRGQDQFVARFFFHHFLGEDDLRWLAQFKELQLSDAEARALVVAREAGAIDNATYREINKVDTLVASAALRRLRDAGLFAQKGRGSATWYQPTDRLLGQMGALSSDLTALPSNPAGLSSNLVEPEQRGMPSELPKDLLVRLEQIGQRHPPAEMRELVVELCQLQSWRVDELAVLLRCKPETIRQDYLRPLMRDGRIAMTNPEKPNDPAQAYRTIV